MSATRSTIGRSQNWISRTCRACCLGRRTKFKYRLAFVVDGICVLRYDNEAGKGDHRHVGADESAYTFTTIDQLLADFWADIDGWEKRYEDS